VALKDVINQSTAVAKIQLNHLTEIR
jgi:hypothetical protein